jgi:hypothetical protein
MMIYELTILVVTACSGAQICGGHGADRPIVLACLIPKVEKIRLEIVNLYTNKQAHTQGCEYTYIVKNSLARG